MTMMQTKMMSRSAVRAVECPACEASAGDRCRGARGRPREANHRERVQAAEIAADEASRPADRYTRND